MLDSISPYALLRASIPKSAPTIVTTYDLYSAAQASPPAAQEQGRALESEPEPERTPAPQQADAPAGAARMPLVPARRTHYISDIKTRHNAAIRRTSFSNHPLT